MRLTSSSLLVRVLLECLEQRDLIMHESVKNIIKDFEDRNKRREPGYEPLTESLGYRLKELVGEHYWRNANVHCFHFFGLVRILMNCLEKRDPVMHERAKNTIKDCSDRNKRRERGYESLTKSIWEH